ncbi:MAG: CBS domain-containing protein, partial [Natronomonas sp.]
MLVPLTVSEVMIRDVETIAPDVTVAEAADRLVGANVGSLVVCDDGRPVGIVTESDLVRLLSEGKDGTETLVHEIASADLQTVTPDTTLEAAAERLEAGDFRR